MVKLEINSTHNVEVRIGGFLACGESLYITEDQYVILDKEKHVGNNLCVHGIHQIDFEIFGDNTIEFTIYHNGEIGEENPYIYVVDF